MSDLTKQEAEKLFGSALETLGLQDNRVNTALRLMYTFGFNFEEATALVEPMKFQNEVKTDRQKKAFETWFQTRLAVTGRPAADIAYEMYCEHLMSENMLQIELAELNAENQHLHTIINNAEPGPDSY